MPSVAGAAFGYSVALSNDTLLVGAAMDDRQIGGGGAAYVFARNGTDWLPQQRLMPDPPSSGASFGYSVALHDDRALVGAPRLQSIINALATTESGEVFAYQRSGGTWAQIQVLKNILPHLNDGFGAAVALSESAALVGACNDASGARGVGADASRRDAGYAGSASLFAFESGRWKVSTYLKSSNAEALDSFGYGVALSGNLAVVAANWESSKATGVDGNMDDNSAERSGAVYVFR
jgi:hypothetical protein